MHINTNYPVTDDVKSMLVRDIQNLISDKSNIYSGIYEVGQRFVRATTPRDILIQFAGYGNEPTIRTWENVSMNEVAFAIGNPGTQQATNLEAVLQMDWLQQFVLTYVPVDAINAVVDNVMSGTAGTGTQYLTSYNILCHMAEQIATYKASMISARIMYESIDSQMDAARSFIRNETLRHDGCDEGKRNFLNGTGLWDEDEVAEMFSKDHIVTISVTMQVTLEREIPGGEDPDDWASDHIDSGDVEQAVRDFLHSDYPDWQIEEVTPS